MSQAGMASFSQIVRRAKLAVLISAVVFAAGCGFVNSHSAAQDLGDPLHLGGDPGPLGSPIPQQVEVRLGSLPNDRIVSLSLTITSLQAINSGNANIELLTPNPTPAPITVEFTRSALVTEPVSLANIYQDTYSQLAFPPMTGQVVFYDSLGQLVSEPLTVPAQSVVITPVALGPANPLVLSVSLDLSQTFTITDPVVGRRHSGANRPEGSGSFVTVHPLVITSQAAPPVPAIAPAVGQPEAGNVTFLVGGVTAVDTTAHILSMQPASGDAVQISYDPSSPNGTQFVNCDPTMLTGMMVETEAATQVSGTVLASRVALIDNSLSSTELYGLLSGYAPEGIFYNLIVDGGTGVNETNSLIGGNVTLDWDGASYAVNSAGLDLSGSADLVFDETRAFPGQFVAVQGDTLVIPDPESDTQAGAMQPALFELNQQTLTGTVSAYTYNSLTQTGSFTLTVAPNAAIETMNPGLLTITVRMVPQTFLLNSLTVANGDAVKVRGLLFVDPTYSNVNYQPSPTSPVAFIMVASRISP